MAKRKTVETVKCPECGGTDFDILCGIRVSCRFGVKIYDNHIVLGDFQEITDFDEENIDKGSETLHCSNCNTEIPMDDLEMSS